MLQHGPGLQGPIIKLLGQLHLTTSNVSLQRQMLVSAGNCQQMLMAALYPLAQTLTYSDRCIQHSPQVRSLCRHGETKLCMQVNDIADVLNSCGKALIVLGLHVHKVRKMESPDGPACCKIMSWDCLLQSHYATCCWKLQPEDFQAHLRSMQSMLVAMLKLNCSFRPRLHTCHRPRQLNKG